MSPRDTDRTFAGSIPQLYDRLLVPLIFEPYAEDLTRRVAAHPPARLLEIAAGTGVVTRRLASALPATTSIVASDLNQAMLDRAAQVGTSRPVQWRQADAMQLPFADESFDVVVCQFGVMFFPDKAKAFAETKRVLRAGGRFIFNVWGRIEHNEFTDTVTQALQTVFPADPPRFMARVPHGYHDAAAIVRDLADGGFDKPPTVVTLAQRSRARSAKDVAVALCQGTPLRSEIEARDASRLGAATDVAAAALVRRFGGGAIDGAIEAHIVSVEK